MQQHMKESDEKRIFLESSKCTATISEQTATLPLSGANFSSAPIQPDTSSSLPPVSSSFDPLNLVEKADLNFSSFARTYYKSTHRTIKFTRL